LISIYKIEYTLVILGKRWNSILSIESSFNNKKSNIVRKKSKRISIKSICFNSFSI